MHKDWVAAAAGRGSGVSGGPRFGLAEGLRVGRVQVGGKLAGRGPGFGLAKGQDLGHQRGGVRVSRVGGIYFASAPHNG